MKNLTLAALGALLLAPPALAAERCNAAAESTWQAAGVKIEAFASGASCETATGVIVMRNEASEPVVWNAYPAINNAALAGKTSAADLEQALRQWIDTNSQPFESTATLPLWAEGADMPVQGEFPFYPVDGMDRAAWEKVREQKAPVFCYVQGIESLACYFQDKESGGVIVELGAQSFPG